MQGIPDLIHKYPVETMLGFVFMVVVYTLSIVFNLMCVLSVATAMKRRQAKRYILTLNMSITMLLLVLFETYFLLSVVIKRAFSEWECQVEGHVLLMLYWVMLGTNTLIAMDRFYLIVMDKLISKRMLVGASIGLWMTSGILPALLKLAPKSFISFRPVGVFCFLTPARGEYQDTVAMWVVVVFTGLLVGGMIIAYSMALWKLRRVFLQLKSSAGSTGSSFFSTLETEEAISAVSDEKPPSKELVHLAPAMTSLDLELQRDQARRQLRIVCIFAIIVLGVIM